VVRGCDLVDVSNAVLAVVGMPLAPAWLAAG